MRFIFLEGIFCYYYRQEARGVLVSVVKHSWEWKISKSRDVARGVLVSCVKHIRDSKVSKPVVAREQIYLSRLLHDFHWPPNIHIEHIVELLQRAVDHGTVDDDAGGVDLREILFFVVVVAVVVLWVLIDTIGIMIVVESLFDLARVELNSDTNYWTNTETYSKRIVSHFNLVHSDFICGVSSTSRDIQTVSHTRVSIWPNLSTVSFTSFSATALSAMSPTVIRIWNLIIIIFIFILNYKQRRWQWSKV